MNRIYKVYPVVNNNILPEPLKAEIVKSYSVGLKGMNVMRPLSWEEESQLLPRLINLSPNAPTWEEKVVQFWNDLTVDIPYNGKTLNGTYVEKNGVKNPENLLDYIVLEAMFKDSNVTEVEDEKSMYSYFLVDEEGEKKKKQQNIQSKLNLDMEVVKLLNDKSEEGTKKLRYILTVFSSDIRMSLAEIRSYGKDYEKLSTRIYELKEIIGDRILSVINDNDLRYKAFIYELVEANILTKVADTYLYMDSIIGESIKDVIVYMKSPSNSEQYNKWQVQLKEYNK